MPKVCRRTGKISYRSESEAQAKLTEMQGKLNVKRRYNPHVEVAVYKCPKCPYWHLTSLDQSMSQGEVTDHGAD